MAVSICYSIDGYSQVLTAEEAVSIRLSGGNVDGRFTWKSDDVSLKALSLEKIKESMQNIDNRGLLSLVNTMTNYGYDKHFDTLFLQVLFQRPVRIDSFFHGADYIRNHFLRSDYKAEQLQMLSFFSDKKNILHWKSFTPYYLTFLDIHGTEDALLYAKANSRCLDLIVGNNGFESIYDTTELNICLARLGVLSDTLAAGQLLDACLKFKDTEFASLDYKRYIEGLSKIRTHYAFNLIGDILSDESVITQNRHLALAAFLAYVKNFPDRSIKRQDAFNLWAMVQVSSFYGKDFSTDDYLIMASHWFKENKDNIALDLDKF